MHLQTAEKLIKRETLQILSLLKVSFAQVVRSSNGSAMGAFDSLWKLFCALELLCKRLLCNLFFFSYVTCGALWGFHSVSHSLKLNLCKMLKKIARSTHNCA